MRIDMEMAEKIMTYEGFKEARKVLKEMQGDTKIFIEYLEAKRIDFVAKKKYQSKKV